MGIFDSVQYNRVRSSKFDLGHEKKLSMQMGDLVPIMCQEIIPGDKFRVKSEIFLRTQAALAPIMHRVDVTTHYFFVPNRLIWTEWEDFITGGRLGVTVPTAPTITISDAVKANVAAGTLADYLGVPDISTQTIATSPQLNVLPFRAYQLIYDQYYRDNILIAPIDCPKTGGGQNGAIPQHMTLRKRAWEKDYFTTSRPGAQLGTEINIPTTNTVNYLSQSLVKTVPGANAGINTLIGVDSGGTGLMGVNKTANNVNGTSGRIENISSIDTAITINNLRRSLKLQEWLEKNMRAGSRYVEQILSHFGVKSSDARLDRAEYLGGGKQRVTFSEVLQTAEGTNPVGTMAGHGYALGTSNRFQRSFEEHGFVIGIMSVLPKTAYQNGLDRMWSRADKFDYYWPEFANIGEQEVKNQEIFWSGLAGQTNGNTWGYQQRYAEYKYQNSTVHGDFKTNLNFWHMGRIFAALPPLNGTFVEADPTNRVFAVTDPNIDKILVQIYNNVDAIRLMPYYSVPSI